MLNGALYRWFVTAFLLALALGVGVFVGSVNDHVVVLRRICTPALLIMLPLLLGVVGRQLGKAGLMHGVPTDVPKAIASVAEQAGVKPEDVRGLTNGCHNGQ